MSNARDGSLLLVPVNVSGCTTNNSGNTAAPDIQLLSGDQNILHLRLFKVLNETLVVADFTCTCHSLYIWGSRGPCGTSNLLELAPHPHDSILAMKHLFLRGAN